MIERSAGRTISEIVAGLNAGQHLALDAVVAFVDGELDAGAHGRAREHLVRCPSCAAEVAAQRQMRVAVQSADGPAVPAGLLAALRSIPDTAVLPPPPEAMGVGPDGVIRMAATPGGMDWSMAQVVPASAASRRHHRQVTVTLVPAMMLGALILVSAGGATTEERQPRQVGTEAPLAASAGGSSADGPFAGPSDTWEPDVVEAALREQPVSAVHGGWAVGLR